MAELVFFKSDLLELMRRHDYKDNHDAPARPINDSRAKASPRRRAGPGQGGQTLAEPSGQAASLWPTRLVPSLACPPERTPLKTAGALAAVGPEPVEAAFAAVVGLIEQARQRASAARASPTLEPTTWHPRCPANRGPSSKSLCAEAVLPGVRRRQNSDTTGDTIGRTHQSTQFRRRRVLCLRLEKSGSTSQFNRGESVYHYAGPASRPTRAPEEAT